MSLKLFLVLERAFVLFLLGHQPKFVFVAIGMICFAYGHKLNKCRKFNSTRMYICLYCNRAFTRAEFERALDLCVVLHQQSEKILKPNDRGPKGRNMCLSSTPADYIGLFIEWPTDNILGNMLKLVAWLLYENPTL